MSCSKQIIGSPVRRLQLGCAFANGYAFRTTLPTGFILDFTLPTIITLKTAKVVPVIHIEQMLTALGCRGGGCNINPGVCAFLNTYTRQIRKIRS